MDQILELRRKAVEQGFVNNNGARHAESMSNSIKRSGWLDEKRLIVESYGIPSTSAPLLGSSRQPSDLSNLGSCRPFSITSGPVRIE